MSAPVIPDDLAPYNSYAEDPKWQVKFTIAWTSVLAFFVVIALPGSLLIRRGDWWGVRETEWEKVGRYRVLDKPMKRGRWSKGIQKWTRTLGALTFWSVPGLGLNLGQLILVIGYILTVILCIVLDSSLSTNANRAGFLALAQLPPLFLLATKNSILSIMLLGPGRGYEKLNYLHRWAGRTMFLATVLHGALWIQNHRTWGLPILGQQKETSGIAALALVAVIVISSLRVVRRAFYQLFFVIHVLAFVAFFVTLCHHTVYARPWIFPPLALYGLDLLMRMFKFRIKDATLVAVDNQMTLIYVQNTDEGWTPGQHVRLRVFFDGRVFESHPLTILSAPSSHSTLLLSGEEDEGGLILGARVAGDWTRALNAYARSESTRLSISKVPVQVMIDGPYGGSSIDLIDHQNVLLMAGGSGATFTLAMLDDLVGRLSLLPSDDDDSEKHTSRMRRRRRVEFVWAVKGWASVRWFESQLRAIMTAAERVQGLDVRVRVYVTCLCDPDSVPVIPGMDVLLGRPGSRVLLEEMMSFGDVERTTSSVTDGGVGVCVAGPEGLTREMSNAVARLSLTKGLRTGGIALHTEVYQM